MKTRSAFATWLILGLTTFVLIATDVVANKISHNKSNGYFLFVGFVTAIVLAGGILLLGSALAPGVVWAYYTFWVKHRDPQRYQAYIADLNEKRTRRETQRREAEAEMLAQREANKPKSREEILAEWQVCELQEVIPDNIIRKADEHFYWQQAAAKWGMHTHTQRVGGYSGVSFRVVKGVYLHTGGYRGTPISQTATEVDDHGMVYVSDHRILFVGSTGAIDVPLDKIASVEPYTDGMRIDVINKKPIGFQTGDSVIAVIVGRVVNKDIHRHSPALSVGAQSTIAAISEDLKGQSPPTQP